MHTEIDRRRSIRVYAPDALTPSKLREAVKLESDAGGQPSLLILEGMDCEKLPEDDVRDLKALAGELAAEVWMSAPSDQEHPVEVPPALLRFDDLISVVLALQPGAETVALQALKDHDNPDLSDLHVSLDPRTLLLVRS